MTQYWLSYGGGVNSTALAVLLCEGKLSQFEPCRIIFADTLTERDKTYNYIHQVFIPYVRTHGRRLEIVKPKEGVLERWKRLKVTGNRILRGCTVEAKIKPIEAYIAENGSGEQLVGIDAGERHRVKDRIGKHYPLVELDIDRDECIEIIDAAGLPIPDKSGCWCCPFLRVGEVIDLIKTNPCKFAEIEELERIATETHGHDGIGNPRTQWGDKPCSYWRQRASQGDLFIEDRQDMPCDCYDG